MFRETSAAMVVGLAVLAGCRSFTKVDSAWKGQIPSSWTSSIGAPEAGSVEAWLDDFQGTSLRGLADAAIKGNPGLAAAAARVRQAEARARAAGAEQAPWLSATLAGDRSGRPAGEGRFTSNTFSLGLNLSWEIDLWGRLEDERQAALAQSRAAGADFDAARLSLVANTLKTSLTLLEAAKQGELAARNLEVLRKNLATLESRLVTELPERVALEIALSRADVHRAEANVAASKRLADAARRRLEILLGAYPAGSIASLDDFPVVRRVVPVGLPSELLLRRPDLLAAERRVEASAREYSASWKALLPSLRLTGGGSSASGEFNRLLDEKTLAWDVAGRLTQQIFQGGRLRAEMEFSQARRDELAARYAEAALQAFREVETALAAEAYYASQQAALDSASQQAETAQELALANFSRGLTDIITVLESTRRAFDARSNLIAVTNQRLQNRLDLYLALGGDFDHPPKVSR